MLMKIGAVYELPGKPENFSFFIHGRSHPVPQASRELICGFPDAHLKPAAATQKNRPAGSRGEPMPDRHACRRSGCPCKALF